VGVLGQKRAADAMREHAGRLTEIITNDQKCLQRALDAEGVPACS
jgi:hypothetical protein